MMKMGVVNPRAVVSASVMCGMAMNHSPRPTVWTAPRRNWPFAAQDKRRHHQQAERVAQKLGLEGIQRQRQAAHQRVQKDE